MKKKHTIPAFALAILAMLCGCNHSEAFNDPFKGPPSTAVEILYDVTDPMASRPDATSVVNVFGFSDQTIYDGYSLRIRRLSDVNLTSVAEASVPGQSMLMGDQASRVSAIRNFRAKVSSMVASLGSEKISDKAHSVIYRTVAEELDHLAAAQASTKICIIYSDLMENSGDADFYLPSTFSELRDNPKAVESRLEKIVPLASLKGVQVYFIFRPSSYFAEQQFDPVYSMYKQMLEAKGATVSAGANLLNQ